MANLKIGAVAILGAALLAVGAGCGGSDADEAETPTTAQTVTNGATETTGGGEDTGGDDAAVAAGKTVFEASCQGCHPAGGTSAGAGPALNTGALTAEAIEKQIKEPMGAMPANLVSGDDLTNVTAYVVSLQ